MPERVEDVPGVPGLQQLTWNVSGRFFPLASVVHYYPVEPRRRTDTVRFFSSQVAFFWLRFAERRARWSCSTTATAAAAPQGCREVA